MKKVLVGLVFAVVVTYGVLGWFVYGYYPPRIFGEDMIHRGLEEVIREVKADVDVLNGRLRACGVQSTSGLKWRREALQRILKDAAFGNLMVKYLGASSISDIRNLSEHLNTLEENRDAVKSAARTAEIEAMAKIEVLKDELEQAREVFEDRLGAADRLRARRDRLNIWPLPWVGKMMSGKEGT